MYHPLMTTLADIGASLAVARRARGISQRDLAKKAGTSQQQIARWEATDYRSANLERVSQVAEILGITANSLPMAAETPAAYRTAPPDVRPVRDLGQIAARLRGVTDTLERTYRFRRVGVFGSFANGEQTSKSDVDLVVDVECPEALLLANASRYLEDLLGRDVDLVRPQLVRGRIRDKVMKETVYVWKAR